MLKLILAFLLLLAMLGASEARPKTIFEGLNDAFQVFQKQPASHKVQRTQRKAIAPRVVEARGRVQDLVVSYARQEGVPTALAYAVAQYESNFNPRARGRAGEWGVMQIKCSTARGIGYRGPCSGLANADTNVRWGIRYLAQAHRLAGGSECLTLSKYNGGHERRSLIPSYCRAVIVNKRR